MDKLAGLAALASGWKKITYAVARQNLAEELCLTELVYRTMRTCSNTLKFLCRRDAWESTGDKNVLSDMQNIALDEKENTLAAIPVYRVAPWLDLALRLDGVYAPCEP